MGFVNQRPRYFSTNDTIIRIASYSPNLQPQSLKGLIMSIALTANSNLKRTQLTRLKALFTTDEVLRKGVYTDKMYSSVTRRAEAKTMAEAVDWRGYKNDVSK